MPDIALPPWTRPIRIPEDVPLTHAEPPFAIVGELGSWTLRFELRCDLPGEWELRLQLHGGRNNKGPFAGDLASISSTLPDGSDLTWEAVDPPGTLSTTLPPAGLARGDVITVVLRDFRAHDIAFRDKFFLLYAPHLNAEGIAPALPETTVSGTGRAGRKVRIPGAIWSLEAQQCIVSACTLHIIGGPTDHLRAYAPPQTRPGEPITVLVRPDDERGNLSHEPLGPISIFLDGEELAAEAEPVAQSTCVRLAVRLPKPGVYRLMVRAGGMEATANPIMCGDTGGPDVYWGMIHGHTEMSDGTGNLEYYFKQMRDEALLDFAASSDHDRPDETPDRFWQVISDTVARWNEPGRFVTLLGYEWAKWDQTGNGDRNVYYLEDHRPIYRSKDGFYPAASQMFEAIQDETAIVIPHHTGHAGNFCDFKDHDPVHERLIEIFQTRGSYERADDNPVPERDKRPVKECGYVSRALAMGWRVGFTAGGDDHAGHAGTDFAIPFGEARYQAGLMAVLAAGKTREAIWDAMWNRRVIATTGPRILLNYTLNGRPMGSELSGVDGPRELHITFHGTAPVERVDVIRSNDIVHTEQVNELDGELTWRDDAPLDDVMLPPAKFCDHPFAFYYVRLIQSDGHVAWASPIWIDPA
jgi:uncharacterized protein DUF3604